MSLISRIYGSTAPEGWDVKTGRKASRDKAKKQAARARKEARNAQEAPPTMARPTPTPKVDTDSKVTQAFTREQRICESHDEGSPRSPGNRYSGSLVGHQGRRSSTEHAVSEANPRSGMKSRAGEAR